MNVHVLPSSRARTAKGNFDALVAEARLSTAFGPIDFDEPLWEVRLTKARRASSARAGVNKLYFTEVLFGAKGMGNRTPLREPMATFLKALVRLREDDSPRHLDDHAAVIRAGRFLHDTMTSIGFDPCRLMQDHFLAAAKASRATDSGSTAYAVGKKLAEIAGAVNSRNIALTRIDFRNPNPRVDDTNARIGPEAEARRESKLPSEVALDALARLANLVTDDVDLLRMRAIELLVCGGWRINELLTLPADCEVEEVAYENGEPLRDNAGNQVIRYGIRYHAEKGAPPLPKWIPTPLVDIAKRAVADILRITQPTREVATWMASNPGKVMLPGFEHGDLDGSISVGKIAEILGCSPTSAAQWCATRDLAITGGSGKAGLVAKRALTTAVLERMSEVPDGSPLRLEQHLFLVPENFLHATRGVTKGSVRFVTDGMIADFIGGRSIIASVFDRFGMTDAEGQPIRMNSHQFRHWLNTLAQQGGMSQHEIARWSGRKDVGQNAAYDHVSGVDLAKRVRALVESGSIKGPLATAQARLAPQDRAKFRETHIATAHVTDIGLCVHDWSLIPCVNHGACAGCDEHVVIKGDVRQQAEAERLLEENRFLLARAEAEVADETYGADRWVESHRRMVRSLEAVVAVHVDGSLDEGTLVHAPGATALLQDDAS